MDWLKLCLLICSFVAFSESAAPYYFVITPNIIRFNHPETVLVSIFGEQKNVRVNVWLQHRGKTFSYQSVTVPNEANPVYTTIRVTEADIFNTVIDDKPRMIQLCSRSQFDSTKCKDVVISYKTGYLILQTDKPIYTPRQKVKIRVLALDESLKTVTGDKWLIFMDIVSPSNLTLGRRAFDRTTSTGFYQNTFTLPPHPETGIWTARAFYGGQFETTARSLFQVEEYVLPTFGVTVDASKSYILNSESNETKIDFTVTAKYVYGKPVAGKARLSLNVTDEVGDSRYLIDLKRKELQSGVVEFSIKIGDIFNSPALKDQHFPDGSRLEVVATVFESATGKEERSLHNDIIFTTEPYIFKFSKSKRYFRSGMSYFLKIDMFTPNNVPVTGMKVKVLAFKETGQLMKENDEETDSNGQALAIFETKKAKRLNFKVIADGFSPSQTFEVLSYEDKNQIKVELKITDDNKMLMEAVSNIQVGDSGPSYTGMLFVVVTRGKVVRTFFKVAANNVEEQIEETLQELINPTARLLVFYVDEEHDRVVADSVKIDVDAKCRGAGLSFKPDNNQVTPGSRDKITLTGTPYSWVGLNAMDKALSLLNDKNILMKNKMFDALRSHDLGCGEGSGKNNGDVFKNAGLFLMTNARVTSDLHRSIEECDPKTRTKRSADDCIGAHKNCCIYGKWCAEDAFNNTATKDKKAKLDSYTLCYAAAKKAFESKRSPIVNCTMAILHSCKDRMDFLISNLTQIVSKSLEDITDYESDLKRLAEARIKPHKRTDFRESFLFEEVQLDVNGHAEKVYSYPDSITEWMIQAIGITENEGMCIADPVDVKVFRKFFIQLDLPYKATRFELFDVKATLFSYGLKGDILKQANIYLEAVDGLCYGTEPGKPSPRQELDVGPNTASTVRFPMIPLKAGKFAVKITAIVTDLGIPMVDIVEKPLFVVNEGILERITIQVCLDPNEQREDCQDHDRVKTQIIKHPGTGISEQLSEIDLALPNIAIQDTGSATAYIQAFMGDFIIKLQMKHPLFDGCGLWYLSHGWPGTTVVTAGNIMDNVVQTILRGVDNLFRIPSGCSEQTISSFAPNVYALMYLKQTKQVTGDVEVKGSYNIRYGVDRERSEYLHRDGSYSCYKQESSSVWLTAFVAKVFCHANTVVDNVLDERYDLYRTLTFLTNHMTSGGRVVEIENPCGSSLKGAIKSGSSHSLTAFVLITLLECNTMQWRLHSYIVRGTKYLERWKTYLQRRPFDLAITTYALALAKSEHRWAFKKLLDSIKTKSGRYIYWRNPSGSYADSYSIETTAYALLAMLQFDDMNSAGHIVRWLTSKQSVYGVFRSTQDTAVGLQALSQYSVRTYTPEVDLKVSLIANNWQQRQLSVKNEKFENQQIVDKLPVEKGDSKLTVLVAGTSGTGRLRIELRYNRPLKDDEICPFELSDINVGDVYKLPPDQNVKNIGKCDVCGHCANDNPNPNYNLLTTPAPVNVTTASNFGRRKRQAVLGLVHNMKCIRFSVRAKPGNQHGMSMIYFNLETDVTVLKEDMEKIKTDNDNVDDFEMPTNNKGFVVFYLNTLTSDENEFVFRLTDNFEGDKNTRQPVSVDVFDYYYPDKYCRKIYGIGPNKGAAVDYKCDSTSKQCNCLKNTCSSPVEKEILKMIKARRKPAVLMGRYTCNPDKANFADIVKVTDVLSEKGSTDIKAIANVTTNIHRGAFLHDVGDELYLFWKATCLFPKLEVGKEYLIIAKDGFRAQDKDGNDEYRYSLMDTALVIEVKKAGTIRNVINAYKKWMKRIGCLSK